VRLRSGAGLKGDSRFLGEWFPSVNALIEELRVIRGDGSSSPPVTDRRESMSSYSAIFLFPRTNTLLTTIS
jgi:hypothetical protein